MCILYSSLANDVDWFLCITHYIAQSHARTHARTRVYTKLESIRLATNSSCIKQYLREKMTVLTNIALLLARHI